MKKKTEMDPETHTVVQRPCICKRAGKTTQDQYSGEGYVIYVCHRCGKNYTYYD